jgi:hypothetical protein
MTTNTPQAGMPKLIAMGGALLLLAFTAAASQAQTITNILTDDFSTPSETPGTNISAPAGSPWNSYNGGSETYELNGSSVQVLELSGLTDVNASEPLPGWTGSNSFNTAPTASSTDINPSDYYLRLTVTGFNSVSGSNNWSFGLVSYAGDATSAQFIVSNEQGVVNVSTGVPGNFTNTPIAVTNSQAATAGTWVLDWYTNEEVVIAPDGSTFTINDASMAGVPMAPDFGSTSGVTDFGGESFVEVSAGSLAVPEPSVTAYFGFGAALALLFAQLRRRRLAGR